MGTRLNALDMAFLALETPKTPVNVAGLSVFKIPSGYKGNFVRDLLKQFIQTNTDRLTVCDAECTDDDELLIRFICL